MDLQTVLLIIGIIMLSIIMFILIGAVIGVLMIKKKISQLPIGKFTKFGGVMSILPIIKFIFSHRHQLRR